MTGRHLPDWEYRGVTLEPSPGWVAHVIATLNSDGSVETRRCCFETQRYVCRSVWGEADIGSWGMCGCDILWHPSGTILERHVYEVLYAMRRDGWRTPIQRGRVPRRDLLCRLSDRAWELSHPAIESLRWAVEGKDEVHALPHTLRDARMQLVRHNDMLACVPTGLSVDGAARGGWPTLMVDWSRRELMVDWNRQEVTRG